MAGNLKRQQTKESGSQHNIRQDRNTFVTDGALWSWDAGSGTLSWTGIIRVRRGGRNTDTILALPGGLVVGTDAGNIAYVDVNRTGGGAVLTMQVLATPGLNSSENRTDERIVIGVRSADGKFYLRDGTIFSDGDQKMLGTLNAVTERNDVAAVPAQTLYVVGFTFLQNSNQLAVYVGGQLLEEGVEYVETSSNSITFQLGFVPTIGERISFLNLVGGQGPPGPAGLQNSYDIGPTVDILDGIPLQLDAPSGSGGTALIQGGNAGSQGGLAAWYLNRFGNLIHNSTFWRDAGGDFWEAKVDDGPDDLLFRRLGPDPQNGFQINKDGSGIEFGLYTGAGPFTTDGALRWQIFTGTLPGVGFETVNTGLSSMISTLFSVDDSNQANYTLSSEAASGNNNNKRHSVQFNNTTQLVEIRAAWANGGNLGNHIDGEAYTLIVFHQG